MESTLAVTVDVVVEMFETAAEEIDGAVELEVDEAFREVIGRHTALLRLAEAAPGGEVSRQGVADAFYETIDAYLSEVCAGDVGLRDALNLLGNAALTYLDDPDAELDSIGPLCYSEDLSVILGWIDG